MRRRVHLWRIESGQLRRPSYDVFSRVERLQTQMIQKAARPKVGLP
jgi:hypothetical protein